MATYEAPRKPDSVVHTGFFTMEMSDLFKDLIENTEQGRHCGARAGKKMQCSEVFINPDGEVVFNLFRDSMGSWRYRNYAWRRTIWEKCKLDAQKIREEIAWILKIMVHSYLDKQFAGEGCHVHWRRDDTTDLGQLFTSFSSTCTSSHRTGPLTVSDVYCIYEILRGRPGIERKYKAEQIKRFRGEQRDPILTEMEVARREQIETIKKEQVELERQLQRDRDNEISTESNRIRMLYAKKIEDSKFEMEKKIKELDEQLSFMQMSA